MYKVSRYNHFQPWSNGYHIAYNARTGAVALMTDENFACYREIVAKLSNGSTPEFTAQEEELLKQLEYGKFVHPDYYDELEELKFIHRASRFEESSLGLVIAPTMACNMACSYCYEENKQGRMSPSIIESIIQFVEKRAGSLKSLTVSWYGGEPLLAMDIIEDLTETFLDICEENEIEYSASMISNGYLLNKENADKLKELKVRTVQVTLDGPSHIHNRKRPLKNGKESFAAILENIAYASTVTNVSIRVNIDKSFTEEMITELLEELKPAGIEKRVGINFGKIEPATSACTSISENCYDTGDFSQVEQSYYRLLFDRGFLVGKLPMPMAVVCMSQVVNSFLIDHEGYLYRCFNFVGDREKAMGNIRNELDYNQPAFTNLFRFDPFENATCRECNILPVCLGGCPARRERVATSEQACETWKHNLEPMLEIIALARQQQVQNATKEQQS